MVPMTRTPTPLRLPLAWLRERYQMGPATTWQDRAVPIALMLAAAIGAVYGALYLVWVRRPLSALAAGGMAVALIALLESWRVHRRFHVALHGGLSAAGLALLVIFLDEPIFDLAFMTWFAVLPMTAALYLGLRAGLAWTAVSASLGVFAWVYGLHRPAASPGLFELIRLLTAIATLMALTLAYEVTRQRALRDAEAASRAKSAFLATMSHEIRTPLNGVLGMTEVMLAEDVSPRQREQLETIQRSGQALVLLINDILDLSKVEATRLQLAPAAFELRPLLEDLARLYRGRAAQAGLEVRLRIDPALPKVVMGDALRLRQVLGNLLGNAVKFTECGSVELEVSPGAAGVRFAVADTGPGIAPEHHQLIFEPFQQVDSSSGRRHGGTGLGLALSRQLVQLLGGKLQVESNPGRGSMFRFEIPLPAAEVLPPPATHPAERAPRRAGRILVVDDNPINLAVARALVEKAGFEAVTASDGAAAVDAAATEELALVLMDCHMPGMDGFEATMRIRALPGPLGHVPVMALTASGMPDEVEACRRAGMIDCLVKPISLATLREALERHARTAP